MKTSPRVKCLALSKKVRYACLWYIVVNILTSGSPDAAIPDGAIAMTCLARDFSSVCEYISLSDDPKRALFTQCVLPDPASPVTNTFSPLAIARQTFFCFASSSCMIETDLTKSSIHLLPFIPFKGQSFCGSHRLPPLLTFTTGATIWVWLKIPPKKINGNF